MFDTHCHLFDKSFETKLDNIIVESRSAGIGMFLIPATDIETSRESIKLSNTYENVYCAIGIHPTEKLVTDDLSMVEKTLYDLSFDKKVVAFGETGLDYYRFKSSPDVQKSYLKMHIKLAIMREKALILHSRQSTTDIISVLQSDWQDTLTGKIIFHCASLEDDLIKFAIENNCYLGVDGDITYDKFKQQQIKKVRVSQLLLETDSPYLLPEPLKSQKIFPNTPGNINIIANSVSELMAINKSDLIEQTTKNAKNVFGIN